jgi:hypothetical protein
MTGGAITNAVAETVDDLSGASARANTPTLTATAVNRICLEAFDITSP